MSKTSKNRNKLPKNRNKIAIGRNVAKKIGIKRYIHGSLCGQWKILAMFDARMPLPLISVVFVMRFFK